MDDVENNAPSDENIGPMTNAVTDGGSPEEGDEEEEEATPTMPWRVVCPRKN